MRKIAIYFSMMMLLLCGLSLVQAQEVNGASDQASSAKPSQPQRSVRPYRLDFSLNELEDGKHVNSRHYSMNLTAGSGDEITLPQP